MYNDVIKYVLDELGKELLLNPNCHKKYLTFNDDSVIVTIDKHTKKYTFITVMCDYDKNDGKFGRYHTIMYFKLKNIYSLTFEVM